WGIRDLDVTTSRYLGMLPVSGQWVQLTVPANFLNLQGTTVYGMAVEAEGGRLAWGHAGKSGATPDSDIVWVGSELPTGAKIGENQGWKWISAKEKLDILTESEEQIAARQIPFASTRALIREGISLNQAIYFISDAAEPLSVSRSDSLTTYVYLDPNNPPRQLVLWWIVDSSRINRRLRQVYWGELGIDSNSNRYMGPLPISGRWVRLEVPVSLLGLTVDNAIVGMAFIADGRVAWAHAGKSTAGAPPEDDQVWIGNQLPAESRIERNDGWIWVELNPKLTPFGEPIPSPPPEAIVENDYGTTITGGVRVVIAVEELKKTLKEKSPLDKDAVKLDALKNKAVPLAALPKGLEIPLELANKIRYDSRRKLLIVEGILSEEERETLKALRPAEAEEQNVQEFRKAIDLLFDAAQLEAILLKIPATLTGKIRYDAKRQLLTIQGVMSLQEKKQLLALAEGNSNADKEFKEVIELLYEQSQDNQDLDKLEELGLKKFIDFLQAKIDSADDKIDLGFVQIQTNMYRIRQYILGTDAASRLAVSPTLAEIAQRKSAAVTEKELSDYIAQIKGKKVEPTEDTATDVSSSTASATESVSPTADAPISRVEISGAESSSFFPTIEKTSTARLFEFSRIEPVIGQPVKPVETVQKQSPIVGEVPRILTVSERLQEPAPKVARAYSLAGRRDIVTSLSDVGIFKGLEVPGLEKVTFSQLQNLSVRAEIVAEIESGASEDAVEDDELTYFSSAVKALDRTAAALRLAERRTQEYRDIINLCQEVLDKLDSPLNQANQRLSAIGDELAETRHDITVARLLLAEEQARIESINQRRDRIIEEYVSFLVFHRPRFVGSGVDVPSRPLDPGLVAAPVPACLRQHQALPPELEEAIELLREAPMKWFTQVSPLLEKLDRIEISTKAIEIAQVVATIQSPVQLALPKTAPGKQGLGQAIQRVFTAQQQVVKQYRQQTLQFDTSNLVSQSWTQVRDRALELLSWGDLIDGRHQRNQVAQEAARQFENVARILACLYSNFAEVLPAIRLDWAERLSQYDRPVNLRNLASLPRWGEIERLERQEMQTLVDWLYQQVDAQQSEAVALISDLIRICILLASHAPVNQIITGRVAQATATLNPGTGVDLTVEPAKVRVGMEVLMYGRDNTVVAKGVVENLTTGLAQTRVVKTFKPNQQLPENARVQLSEPGGFNRSPFTSGIGGLKMSSF
ncbi:MAG: hypothetical protein QNJ65_02950, partial [Xenococcaceae cyanobacterium MO_234.B1]|nr:hypothetical protein [Xenococcaceae cyanobacterium MO_234.B1]